MLRRKEKEERKNCRDTEEKKAKFEMDITAIKL